MSSQITGIIAAIATPFKGDGIDYDTFAKQASFLIENGASALAYPMHYGELLSLRDSERNECARVMAEVAKGRVPTFVNVSSAGTDLAIDAAAAAAKAGTDGIVLLAPYHWRPGPEQIVEHFVAVANAHGGKLIVYNNVEATGVAITNDILRMLIERIPGFVGLKDASFDMRAFTGFCHATRDARRAASRDTGVGLFMSRPVQVKFDLTTVICQEPSVSRECSTPAKLQLEYLLSSAWRLPSSAATLSSWTMFRLIRLRGARNHRSRRATRRYLPRSSPDLNPIETGYSVFKSVLRNAQRARKTRSVAGPANSCGDCGPKPAPIFLTHTG